MSVAEAAMITALLTPQAVRGRLTDFVRRHELAWDLVMGVLTVVYVILAFREDSATGLTEYAVWSLAVVFLVEFGARCYDSPDRIRYLHSHWLDLITAIPVPGIPGLRFLRLLRLLRFLKVGIVIRRILLGRGWDQGGLIWPTLFVFWIGSAFALLLVENDVPGSSINTFPDAMTAAFLTAATLGFGKHWVPVTQDGQIVSAVIVFFALGLWGFASSNLTRHWLNAKEDWAGVEIESIGGELQAIRAQLTYLCEAMQARQSLDVPVQVTAPTATGEPEHVRF